jgi:hypothetical protein
MLHIVREVLGTAIAISAHIDTKTLCGNPSS